MNNVVEISGGKEKNYQVIRVTLETCKMGEEMGVDNTVGLALNAHSMSGAGDRKKCSLWSGSSRYQGIWTDTVLKKRHAATV